MNYKWISMLFGIFQFILNATRITFQSNSSISRLLINWVELMPLNNTKHTTINSDIENEMQQKTTIK